MISGIIDLSDVLHNQRENNSGVVHGYLILNRGNGIFVSRRKNYGDMQIIF